MAFSKVEFRSAGNSETTQVPSVAEPKVFIFGFDFGHIFGSGSSSSCSHILALKKLKLF